MKLLGVRVPGPLSTLGAVIGTAQGVAGLMVSRRKVWSRPGRLYIEVHGVRGAGGGHVARRIERALDGQAGVAWARVNADSSRVVIALGEPPRPRGELIRLIEQAESEPSCPEERTAEEELHHPADGTTGTRLVPTLAADVFGLGLSLFTRLAPWAPLPAELAALPSVFDHHPKLRALVADRSGGRERADSATSIAGALAHGLAARSEGTLLDTVQRFGQWQEARAHERAWCAAEAELITGPEHAAADQVVMERPAPLPETDAERYERRVLTAGTAASLAALPLGGPRRAAALTLAALPKAVAAGQAGYGARLGRVLAARGALVMDRAVLRELGRTTVLLIDERALEGGRPQLSDLVPLAGGDPREVAEHTWRLFDAADPAALHRSGGWSLGPLDKVAADGDAGASERAKLVEQGATEILGLARGDELVAVLALAETLPPGVLELVAAARHAGLTVVSTGEAAKADRTVAGDGRLVASLREFQAAGEVVLLVSSDRRALGTADCGVGTHREGDPPPWGAHVLVGEDLSAAALLVEAVAGARDVAAESVKLAKAATGVGAVSALQGGRRTSPATRSLRAVNAGAALAVVNGHRHARRLRPPEADGLNGKPESVPWHLMPPEAVLDRLAAGRDGLSTQEVKRRGRRRGDGRQLDTSLGTAFLAELANPLTPVLAGGAALSAAVGSPVDAALVAGVTGLSALLGSVQQVHTERQLAELLDRSAVSARVLRDGEERTVAADELIPGDVVTLAAGDVVPADCRLLEADGVEADESSLTGESLPVVKDPAPVVAAEIAERASMLYEGTTVAAGRVLAVVVATGADTEAGRSMAMARENAPDTGVEKRLTELTEKSMPLALGSAAAVAGAGLLRGIPLRESMSAAVNLAVASVPEGLPFLVNAAQLAAARRLAEHGALVRNPRSIEALGRVDVLCFDKTGTLTEGKLSVREIDDGNRVRRIDRLDAPAGRVLAAALRATPPGEPSEVPHATDRAVLAGGQRAGVAADTGAEGWELVEEVPFEPSRGFHAAIGSRKGTPLLSVKGAPEAVLPQCTRFFVDGRQRGLQARDRRRLDARMKRLARAGHRVLTVAERELPTGASGAEAVEELTFLGFVAIADPVRDGAAPAAAQLREAGVRIVMITGDHPDTGQAIASEVDYGDGEPEVVTGGELAELDDTELAARLSEVDVIARCSPAQKVRIIKAYQGMGRTVAMTGDGANDAPAIRLADVGIALGGHGTPAARAAADLVVTDDRLETIIAALVEGRAMWASVREALGVLLGGNLGEIAFSVLGAVLTGRSPLTARQFLLVNLLTDLAPSLAIALHRPDGETVGELLGEGPESSLGKPLHREIGLRAGVTTAGATAAWSIARFTGRRRRAGTVALAALVGTQLGQTVATGGRSPAILVTGLGSAALLAAVIQTPGVSQFFGCTPLGPVGWTIALGSATSATVLGTLASRLPEL
ncbi:cation-translocating P-type ATPase [Amycolatopsis nigrescens]|uniref:cation-translocating P-type ATPase n=1 Tax=Amycolatopsis nigrescens TaxID=381445 RepID=UPI00036F727D|nr:cation-transporting P-type ATPase [Amycolatopsis nigrescens]